MSLLRSFVLHLGCIPKFLCQNLSGIQKTCDTLCAFFHSSVFPLHCFVLLWFYFCQWLHIHSFLFACVIATIPVLVTGGIHLDGYCDTVDALSSRQPREKKLEILKDPHTGCICGAVLLFILLVICRLCNRTCREFIQHFITDVQLFCSRCISGFAVVTFRSAKSSGLLHTFTDAAQNAL